VLRQIQIVALVLIACLLGSSGCAELCSILACDRPVQASADAKQLPPCHRNETPKHPAPPADKACTHQEFVAENRTTVPVPDSLQTFVANDLPSNFVALLDRSSLVPNSLPLLEPSHTTRLFVLRI